jgi:hypothetical protein
MKPLFTVLALMLALPASALAKPDDLRNSQPVRSGSLAASPALASPKQDLRAPDRDPVAPVPVRGTDVAAPDQQSPRPPVSVPVPVPHADGFDWNAAGIGAAAGIALLTGLLATGLTRRRRQARRPSAATG